MDYLICYVKYIIARTSGKVKLSNTVEKHEYDVQDYLLTLPFPIMSGMTIAKVRNCPRFEEKEKGRQIAPAAHTFREVGTLPVKATIGSNDPSRSRVDQKYIVIMTDIGLVATGLR